MFTTELTPIENNNQRVLTTEQLAEVYQTGVKVISMNFNRNKNHYTAGVHYYCLTGNELKEFFAFNNLKNTNISKVRTLYLWTERGALLHAKKSCTNRRLVLNTGKSLGSI